MKREICLTVDKLKKTNIPEGIEIVSIDDPKRMGREYTVLNHKDQTQAVRFISSKEIFSFSNSYAAQLHMIGVVQDLIDEVGGYEKQEACV